MLRFSHNVISRVLACLFLLFLTAPVRAQVSVLTQHNDNQRTGANLGETTLNTGNVNVNTFGKLFSRTVDDRIWAQPLYVPNLAIPGQGTHNVVFVCTTLNSVYAFDADDPAASTPLWQRSLNLLPVEAAAFPRSTREILGTPVIDPVTQTMYAVVLTQENGTLIYRLHALDITTGQSRPNSPVVISGGVPGTGQGSSGGVQPFNAQLERQRPGLLLLNGVVYIAFGAATREDPGDIWHGWVMGYDAATLVQRGIFCVAPNGNGGGIWQAGQGLTADVEGNIYAMTSNGTYTGSTGGADFGDSLLKLHPNGSSLDLVDWFTPYNQDYMNTADQDFGSSGPLLIPGTNLVLGGDKLGQFYLADRTNLGRYQTTSNSQLVQNFKATNLHIHGSPVYWNSPNQGPLVYVWSEQDNLKAYKLVSGQFQTTPVAMSAFAVSNGMPGGMLSISANGSTAGSGILWVSHPWNADANASIVAGVVRAFDASDVSKELWNSKQSEARDDIGLFAKFCPPTVANGKVYMATFSNKLAVYGLLPAAPVPPTPPALVAQAGYAQVWLRWNATTGATSYDLKRSTVSGGPHTTIARNLTALSYSDTDVVNGTTYYYVLAANNSGGSGPASAEAMATPSATQSGMAIGINFVGGGSYGNPAPLAPNEKAGCIELPHWNSGAGAIGALTGLVDNSGVGTGAAVTWAANGVWSTIMTETPGNIRMMKGYLNTSDTSTTTVQVSGLPVAMTASGYDVYVYFDGANFSEARSGNYTIGATTITGTDAPQTNFARFFTPSSGSTAGNYLLFSNLTGSSFSLTATPAGTGNPRAPVNGLQIVAHRAGGTAPAVSFTTPVNDAYVTSLSSLRGNAIDNSGLGISGVKITVQRLSDGQYWTGSAWTATRKLRAATLAGTSWTCSGPGTTALTSGPLALTAEATDGAGNVGSATINVTADVTPPTTAFTTPTNGATLNRLTAISGTIGDGATGHDGTGSSGSSRVSLRLIRLSDNKYWTGSTWSATDTSITTTLAGDAWTRSTGLPASANLLDGNYQIIAKGYDVVGNNASVSITITVRATLPTVTFTTPTAGATLTRFTSISGTALDNSGSGLSRVSLRIVRLSDSRYWTGSAWSATNNSITTTLSGTTGTVTWTRSTGLPAGANLPDGNYQLTASAYDVLGNSASASTSVTVRSTLPTVTFTTPTDGATISGFTTIGGTARDNSGSGLNRVSLRLIRLSDNLYWTGGVWSASNNSITTTLSGTVGTVTWIRSTALPAGTNLPNGSYRLTARAYDNSANMTEQAIVVTVGAAPLSAHSAVPAPPALVVLDPARDANYPSLPTAQGTAADNSGSGLTEVTGVLYRYATATTGAGFWAGGNLWTATLNEANQRLANGLSNWKLPLPALEPGRYWLQITVRDNAGNAKATTVSFSIDAL